MKMIASGKKLPEDCLEPHMCTLWHWCFKYA